MHIDTETLVIQHRVRSGAESRYETWLREIVTAAQKFDGHLGVNVVRPTAGSDIYTVILRFDNDEHLRNWIGSETRKEYISRVHPLLLDGDRITIETGLEYWFTPPGPAQRRAKPYKQFLVTFSAIFPLTLVVPWALRPILESNPYSNNVLVEHFVGIGVMVWLVTYVIMPRYTRLISKWLFE